MAVNRFLKHILVLPEDDANGELANGFHLELPATNLRKMQVLNSAGGWRLVIDEFCARQANRMREMENRYFILLLDLDGDLGRIAYVKERIPLDLIERVFVLSVKTEPEDLKRYGGQSLEAWGARLASECGQPDNVWAHPLLSHNRVEIERLQQAGLVTLLFS